MIRKKLTLSLSLLLLMGSLAGCGKEEEKATTEAAIATDEATEAATDEATEAATDEASESLAEEETTAAEADTEEDSNEGILVPNYSYASMTGQNIGNDDYVITDIDVIGYTEENSGTPDYERVEINTSIHFDYDFANSVITQTINNDYTGDSDNTTNMMSRCDIPGVLNIYNYPDVSYCSFLLGFNEIDTDRYNIAITNDGEKITGEHISLIPEYNPYNHADINSEVTFDDNGIITEYFANSEYEPEEGVELENPELSVNKWKYDDQGRVIQFNDYYREVLYDYSDNNHLSRETYRRYNLSGDRDSEGRFLEYEEYTVDFEYDENDRIIKINRTEPSDAGSSFSYTIAYDDNGNATSVSKSSCLTESFTCKTSYYRYALKDDLINNTVSNSDLTPGQIYNAVKNYCLERNPEIENILGTSTDVFLGMGQAPMDDEYCVTFHPGNSVSIPSGGMMENHIVNFHTGEVRIDGGGTYNAYDYLD